MGIRYARTVDINEVVEEFIRVHPRRLFDHSLFVLMDFGLISAVP